LSLYILEQRWNRSQQNTGNSQENGCLYDSDCTGYQLLGGV